MFLCQVFFFNLCIQITGQSIQGGVGQCEPCVLHGLLYVGFDISLQVIGDEVDQLLQVDQAFHRIRARKRYGIDQISPDFGNDPRCKFHQFGLQLFGILRICHIDMRNILNGFGQNLR